MRKKVRSAYLLESLEARLLFSADLAPLPVDGGTTGAEFESDLEISLQPDGSGVQEAKENTQERQEVIFVDSGVDDYQQLIDDIESQLEKGRQFDIVNLESDSDGIDQISAYLKQHEGIDAVHVVSHGSEDAVKLGNVWLTPDKLDAYADAIEGWQQALSDDADLLFYGCNLAADDGGQDLVNSLTLLTGADVAASDDVTGSAQLGGDWVLEYRKGEIETAAAINNEIQQNWNGVLASFTVDTTADTVDANPGDGVAEDASGDTSLRAAIMEANALAGADSVYLSADTYGITRFGFDDSTGDLDIRDDLSIVGESPATTVITGNNGYRVFEVHNDAAITVSFENLKILDGQTGAGGPNGAGLLINGGATMPEVYVSNVWLSGNNSDTAGGMGGAIANSANLTITNSLIEGNDADEGGGVWNQPSGFLSMVNVTISGNNATDGDGGGFFNEGTATLRHVTITNNTASATGGGLIHDDFAVSTDIGNSIIAGNTAGSKPDVSSTIGTITSSGGNIVQDATGASGFGAPEIGIDPLLGGLNNNGGNLMTHEPSAPQAIDSAIRALSPTTDQRGFLRGDGNPDIGAYEASSDSTMTAHYLDQFNATAYNGNDGTLSWTNDWQEIGESNGAGTGAVSVWDELGEDGLYLWGANNVGAWRQADLSGATQAALSFNWAMTKTESGDQVVLQISTDGVVWTTLDTFDGPLDHTSMQSASYDISAYIDSDTRIRFETVSGFADNDVFFVDNVSIVLRTSPPVVANLSPVKDTWITINNPIDNFGADAVIRMDEKGNGLGEGHVLLQFDLSSIPAGATITSAVLQMEAVNKSNSGSSTINVYEITEAWDEGSGGNNDATWNNRQTGLPWGTPGGSVDPTSVASLTTSATGGHTWDITALVQDWQSGDKINNGMMLASDDNGDVIFDYDSREGGTPPKLVITHSMPANDAPTVVTNASLNVPEEATRTITSAYLETTDPDNSPDQIIYTLTSLPSGGSVRLNGTPLTSGQTFTQDDINNNRVTYRDSDEGETTSFTMTVSDGNTTLPAFSFSINGQPINDAPVVAAPGSALSATEQIGLAIHGTGFSVSDPDESGAGAIATLTVGEGTISVVEGNSGVSIDSGDGTGTVALSGSIAQLNALLTGTSTGTITYLNNSDNPSSNTTLSITVNDQGNTGTDPGLTGDGSSEEGSNSVTINIALVNDAPDVGNAILTAVFVNTADPSGDSVSNLFASFSDPDAGAILLGVAVVGNPEIAAEGVWQYSTDGNNWADIGTVADDNSALALSSTTMIRFLPTVDYSGTPGALMVRALDNTFGGSFSDTTGGTETRATLDASVNGDPTPISGSTASLGTSVSSSPVIAADDSYATDENNMLIVAADGVLENDALFGPFMVTAGATLEYLAWQDIDGNNVWEDTTGIAGYDLDFTGATVIRDTLLSNAPAGISAAYAFDGSGGGEFAELMESLAGDPSNNSASFEFWIRPSDASGREIIFDTGSASVGHDGAALRLNGSTLEWVVWTGGPGNTVTATQDIATEIASGEFIQVVATVNPGNLSTISLRINGGSTATGSNVTVTDWASFSAPTGVGAVGGTGTITMVPAGEDPFIGEIAAFRFYEFALSDGEVQQNYDAMRINVVSHDLTSASGATVVVNADGGFSYDPGTLFDYLGTGEIGTDTFSYIAEDASGNQDTATVSITVSGVNDNPTGSGSLTATDLNDNAGAANLFSGLTVSDADAGESDLILRITLSSASTGTITGGGFTDQGGGVYTATGLTVTQANTALDNVQFTPADNTGESGSFNTDISVDVDDQGGAGYQSVLVPTTVTINRVNDNPTGSGSLTATDLNDNAGTTNLFSGLTVSDADAGESDLILRITLSSASAGTITGGGFTDQGGGVYTATGLTVTQANTALDNVQFTPADNTGESGSFNTDISVDVDDQGGAGYQSVLAPTTVTINRVNDNPTGSGSLTATSLNDNAGATNLFSGLTVSDADAGESDLILRITLSSASAGTITGGGFTDQGGGVYTATGLTVTQANTALDNVQFTPADNTGESGSFNTDISVDVDDQGGAGYQSVLVPTTVTINRVNDAPALANTTLVVSEGQTVTITSAMLSATDMDTTDTALTFTVSMVTGGQFELIGDPGNAITSFTQQQIEDSEVVFADNGDEAAPAFDVQVSDGEFTDGPIAATINFTNVNDTGTVTIDNTTPAQGDTLTANVIDPDGISGAIAYQWLSDGAVIGGATGKSYTTTQGDVGAVMTMTAIYTDDQGAAEILTSAPTAPVTNVNDTPIAVNDNLNATEDQSMTFTSVTDLLGNDSDIDGDTLTISSFSQPANGSLADNGDGTVTYTSAGNFSGVDSFTYTISDNKGGTAAGAAIIVVTPVGDTPQVTNVSTNAEVQSELINIDRNANDGAEVTHFKISGITNGTLYLADGVIRIDDGDFITVGQGQTGLRFTPAANSTADGSFSVESSEDGASVASQSGIATSTISVLTTAPQPSEPEQSPIQLNTDETVSEETKQEENEELEDVAEETEVQAVAEDMASVEAPQNAKAPGIKKASMVPGISVFRRADLNSSNDRTPGRSMLLSPQTLKKLIESENLGELKTALRKLDITTLPPDVYALVRGSLDAVQEEMGKEILIGKTVVGSAIATSVGLSAGYVVWMLKGGSLLASVLSSLPAWQLADPLAILVGTKEDEDEDDDTLETIIKDGSRRNEDKESKASELDKHKKESTKR